MVQAMAEVPEASAEGPIKTIYEDIKATLRVPYVGAAFRALATYPDYLTVAWRTLKPNAETAYFEAQADDLRRIAVEGMRAMARAPEPPPEAARVVNLFVYVVPKYLLASAALRSATNGEQPRMQRLTVEQKRQIAPGIPEELKWFTWPDEGSADERTQAWLGEIAGTLGSTAANPQYLAVGAWPDYAQSAWNAFKPVIERDEYHQLRRSLGRRLEEAITALPFRMDIAPHILRNIGLSERDIDGVRQILSRFSAGSPAAVLNAGFLASGKDTGNESPFPPAYL